MRRTRAFTLVELMAALVIAGVLAFVATSSWPAYWQRTRRAAAGAALVATLSQLEVRYARTGSYDEGPGPVPHADGYSISSQPCSSIGVGPQDNQCVEVIAIPDPGQGDITCGMLVLRSTGQRWPENRTCWP